MELFKTKHKMGVFYLRDFPYSAFSVIESAFVHKEVGMDRGAFTEMLEYTTYMHSEVETLHQIEFLLHKIPQKHWKNRERLYLSQIFMYICTM